MKKRINFKYLILLSLNKVNKRIKKNKIKKITINDVKKGIKKNKIKKYIKVNKTKKRINKKIKLKKIKFFKNDVFFFLRKLFNSFIKKGKKYKTINYFLKVFFFVSLKVFKSKNVINKKKYVFLYFYKILYNILPIFIYTNIMFRGENKILPWIRKNKKTNKIKLLKISANWVKNAIIKRKEKTLFFKIISELEDLRKNKGESVKNKNDYYLEFHNNKYFVKFLRKKIWA